MTQPEPERPPGNAGGQDPDGGPDETKPPDPAGPGAPPSMPRVGRRAMDPWQVWLRWAEELATGHVPDVPIPAWLRRTRGEARWPITISVAVAIVLQILLPSKFTEPLPGWLLPALEGVLLVGLTVADPVRVERGGMGMRAASIVMIFLVTAANAVSAVLLCRAILDGRAGDSATPLFATGASTAFSPTDVMPLSKWAKLTMLVQSSVSLAIGALVIARAVNILRT